MASNLMVTLVNFLPAMLANCTPVVFGKMKIFEMPINRGLFGKNKTWKGLFVGMFFAGLTGWVLGLVESYFGFGIISGVFVGFMLGLGALLGDLVKSFIKRRMEIEPGRTWFPFDQIDWILGAYIMSWPLFSVYEIVFLLVVGVALHILTNFLAIKLGLKKTL